MEQEMQRLLKDSRQEGEGEEEEEFRLVVKENYNGVMILCYYKAIKDGNVISVPCFL